MAILKRRSEIERRVQIILLHHGNRREIETLPSGKQIWRFFNASGAFLSERHVYPDEMGNAVISLDMRFGKEGAKVGESYLGRVVVEGRGPIRRYIKRDIYEQQRQQFPDMPAADPSVVDESAQILEKSEREAREQAASAARLGLTPSEVTKVDLFCASIMEKGRCANAIEWVKGERHTLGVMDEQDSRRLITGFVKLGAIAMYACEIRSYPDGEENTGHLVIELPRESPARKALLRELDRLPRKQGFRGDPDDGQRFAYVKLD